MQLNFFDKNKNTQVRSSSNSQNINSPSAISRIPGLKYVSQFISADEESELLRAIDNEKWLTDLKRRVQHYGWKYDYKARSIDYSMYLGELPNWAKSIADRLHHSDYIATLPDQLIINEYQPGQGIANHVDCEPCFGETIISVSLGSSCVMDFINLKSKERIEIMLEPRSLVIITGAARHDWSHGIASRKTDEFNGEKRERQIRVSLTFRNVILKTRDLIK